MLHVKVLEARTLSLLRLACTVNANVARVGI